VFVNFRVSISSTGIVRRHSAIERETLARKQENCNVPLKGTKDNKTDKQMGELRKETTDVRKGEMDDTAILVHK
jgi:hypothetical protein